MTQSAKPTGSPTDAPSTDEEDADIPADCDSPAHSGDAAQPDKRKRGESPPEAKRNVPRKRAKAGTQRVVNVPQLRVPRRILEVVVRRQDEKHAVSRLQVGDVVAGLEPEALLPNRCKEAKKKYGNLGDWDSIKRRFSCCFNWSHNPYTNNHGIRLLVVVGIDTPATPHPSLADTPNQRGNADSDSDSEDSHLIHPCSSKNSICWPGGEDGPCAFVSSCPTVRVREVCYDRGAGGYFWPKADHGGIVSVHTLTPLHTIPREHMRLCDALSHKLNNVPALLGVIDWIALFGTTDQYTTAAKGDALEVAATDATSSILRKKCAVLFALKRFGARELSGVLACQCQKIILEFAFGDGFIFCVPH